MADTPFANDATFIGGTYNGENTKETTPSILQASGFIPGAPLVGEYLNYELNQRPAKGERANVFCTVLRPAGGGNTPWYRPTDAGTHTLNVVAESPWVTGLGTGANADYFYVRYPGVFPAGGIVRISQRITLELTTPGAPPGHLVMACYQTTSLSTDINGLAAVQSLGATTGLGSTGSFYPADSTSEAGVFNTYTDAFIVGGLGGQTDVTFWPWITMPGGTIAQHRARFDIERIA